MIARARIEAVLDRIRPVLWADGANVELIDVREHSATVHFTGLCSRCVSAPITMQAGLSDALRREIPEFRDLHLV